MRRQCVGLATAVLVTGGMGLAGLGAAADAHAQVGPFADYPCPSYDPFCHGGDGHGGDGHGGDGHGGDGHGGDGHGGDGHGGDGHGGGGHGGGGHGR